MSFRYRRFLELHKSHPGKTLVPMMDIDLMWHAHMGDSKAYARDTIASFGRLLSHNDDLDPTVLGESFGATKALYEQRFPSAGLYNPPPTQVRPPHGIPVLNI